MVLSLDEAEKSFVGLLDQLDPRKVAEFLNWIGDSFTVVDGGKNPNQVGGFGTTEAGDAWNVATAECDALLRKIAVEMRSQVPISAVLDSETTCWPEVGLDSDCDPATTVHVDSFLYDDDDVDQLVDDNLLSRNYCVKCGSKEVKPLTFISHSLSVDQLRYMFTVLVPLNEAMSGRMILDIGSRLGAVLFAVYYYGSSRVKATGIEINKDLCLLQEKVFQENDMEHCLKAVNDDVRNQSGLVASADVVVMNNVFSFFLPVDAQVECWKFLHENIRPGAVIISNPTMEEVTEHLSLPFAVADWVDKIDTGHLAARFAGTNEELFEDCEKISLYCVKKK